MGPKGFSLKINRMLEYPPRQQIYIEFRDKLRKKSNYSLNLRWYSKLSSDAEGFYVDEYESDGMKKLLAATILGPGKARKAFPCFDEPHLRANFKISLFRDRFHIGLSNSIVHATDDVGFYMGKSLVSCALELARFDLLSNDIALTVEGRLRGDAAAVARRHLLGHQRLQA